jgi:Uma2 family endonuclease
MVIQHRLSVEDYLALPEEKPYRELVNGEALPKMAPDFQHMTIDSEIVAALRDYCRAHGGHSGPEGRVRVGDMVYLPDAAYWAPGRSVGNRRLMDPPTLAVEICSEGQPLDGLREKCRYYRLHGVDAAWLIDPGARTAELFEGARDGVALPADGTLESAFLPGFRLPLPDLFAALDQ